MAHSVAELVETRSKKQSMTKELAAQNAAGRVLDQVEKGKRLQPLQMQFYKPEDRGRKRPALDQGTINLATSASGDTEGLVQAMVIAGEDDKDVEHLYEINENVQRE